MQFCARRRQPRHDVCEMIAAAFCQSRPLETSSQRRQSIISIFCCTVSFLPRFRVSQLSQVLSPLPRGPRLTASLMQARTASLLAPTASTMMAPPGLQICLQQGIFQDLELGGVNLPLGVPFLLLSPSLSPSLSPPSLFSPFPPLEVGPLTCS